jgi:uncharacterized protein (DUF934 family)
MTLIKEKQLCHDEWQRQVEGEPLQASHNIISLDYWLEKKAILIDSPLHLGLMVKGDELPENFVGDLERFSLIVIDIPAFADGRAYSLATLLRTSHHYLGEIRAVGDVLPDQALYLTRVGFNALEFPSQTSAELALKKLTEFSVFYQKTAI